MKHFGLVLVALLSAAAARAEETDTPQGLTLLRTYCAGCHQESAPGQFSRISAVRKTPEGWLMTLYRMRHSHSSALPEPKRDTLIRYLTDIQGLAPSEAAAGRFALERRPNVPDMTLPGDLQLICARCHTAARVALQRRDADAWLKHVHWHLAQWPTIEYHSSARDRFWWQRASTEVPAELGKLFPFTSQSWSDWRARPPNDLSGTWLVLGHTPGQGELSGYAQITKTGEADYTAAYRLDTNQGQHIDGNSKAIVYSGFEWRGTATHGSTDVQEVFAASEDGNEIKGRWFLPDHSEVGGEWTAVRADAAPRILAVMPRAIRAGRTQRVTVIGQGLDGKVDFGQGMKAKLVSRDANKIVADVTAAAKAAAGYRTVTVGGASAAALVVYDRIDRLEVMPAYAIARLGGGHTDPVAAQFEATAYIDVPKPGNGEPQKISLGQLPVTWTAQPFDQAAKQLDDVKFAGTLDQNGRYLPAGAGPNPARKYSGNNVGNLSIVASLQDGDRDVTGNAHLIVTVQRWNTPPIY